MFLIPLLLAAQQTSQPADKPQSSIGTRSSIGGVAGPASPEEVRYHGCFQLATSDPQKAETRANQWRLDGGGPHARDIADRHSAGAFLFPQMTRPPEENPGWSPEFLDYLFLAFNTSTAFSPTDTAVLTRWAKVLMMTQSIISLTVIAILAARAGSRRVS